MVSGQSSEANRQKQTLMLSQGYSSPPKMRWFRVLLQSIVGISVGMLVGGALLWWLWRYSGYNTTSAPPPRTTKANRPTMPSLYQACLEEARKATPGPAYKALRTEQKSYALRWHLEWLLASNSLAQNKAAQAAEIYQRLTQEEESPLPSSVLYIRQARAWINLGKKEAARSLLQKHTQTLPFKRKSPLYNALLEQEVAEGLKALASVEETNAQHIIRLRLWAQFPHSPLAAPAFEQWSQQPKHTLSAPEIRWILRGVKRWNALLAPPKPLAKALERINRKSLDARQRALFDHLQALLALRQDLWKKAMSFADRARKDMTKSAQAELSFAMATLALEKKKRRLAYKMIRKIRSSARYWRRVSMLAEIESLLRRGKWKPALRLSAKAWRRNRTPSIRAQIARYLGLSALGRKQYKKANTYFSTALQQHKRAGGDSAIEQDELLYWMAFSQEMRGKAKPATQTYLKIFRTHPFSYFGFLAMDRLRELGQPQPLPFLRPKEQTWSLHKIDDQRTSLLLQTLHQFGPNDLFLVELERWHQKNPQELPITFYQMLFQKAQQLGILYAARSYVPNTSPTKTPQALTHLRYPSQQMLFDKAAKTSDTRLFAALWSALRTKDKTSTPQPPNFLEHPFFHPKASPVSAHPSAMLALWKTQLQSFPKALPLSARWAALLSPSPQTILHIHKQLGRTPLPQIEALYPQLTRKRLFYFRLYNLLYLP
ncbi:MAG: hypothetical protein H6728_07685 [Myxococcales bacterium]|nr:hypothetical protein [Myxococcales bacterium]MCB9642943.1 hypothetical protein [Myxococcales bacterium]